MGAAPSAPTEPTSLSGPLPAGNVFDYVVVGGGAAGLTVANRLTENPDINVLLLEAGVADVYEQKIMVPAFQGSSGFAFGACGGYNWCDQTVPQIYLDGQNITIPQGYGLGGGTLINAMLWNRGDTEDYDTWAALGAEGWDFNSMLPYFIKSETFTPEPNAQTAQAYGIGEDPSIHGTVGPQNVTFPNFLYTPSQNFFAAMQSMGIQTQTDPAEPQQKGAMFLPQGISPWNQSRADARRMRWDPVATRPNFYVATNAHVQRVLFEGGCSAPANNGSLRAVGVEVMAAPGDDPWYASATREVILSAGALRSPQTLELSGIGDPNIVNGLGLASRLDLPGVGNNLQDHMLMHMAQAFQNTSYVYSNILNNATINQAASDMYYANRTGPYTFGPPDGNAFLSLPQFSNRSAALAADASAQGTTDYLAPGLDPTVIAGYAAQRKLLIPALANSGRGAIEFLQDDSGNTQISNMRPLTRGTVHAISTDAFTYPALDMRYASNPVDYNVMFDALRWNDALFQTPEIQIMQPAQYVPPHAGTDEQFQQFMNSSLGTEFHPSCTAAMVPRDMGGVVDSNLLVYGTQNLRVVDASVFPIVPAAHLEAVVYGVAEKAADIIKGAQSPSQVFTPPTTLDNSTCTVSSSPHKRSVEVNEYPSHNVHNVKRQQGTPASSADNTIPTFVGAYPDYGSVGARAPPTAPQNGSEPASRGLPKGQALDLGDALINGTAGMVSGVLGSIDNGLGSLLGGGLPPGSKYTRRSLQRAPLPEY